MKATGIVRRIDDLGRIVIPKEIRRTLRIREGDPLEIFTDKDGEVIFKKYSPIGELGDYAGVYAETLSRTSGHPAIITDKDAVVAVYGVPKKELMDKKISETLEKSLEEKKNYMTKPNDPKKVPIVDGIEKYSVSIMIPIISEGDVVGSVVLLDNDQGGMVGEVESKLATVAAGFLSKNIE